MKPQQPWLSLPRETCQTITASGKQVHGVIVSRLHEPEVEPH